MEGQSPHKLLDVEKFYRTYQEKNYEYKVRLIHETPTASVREQYLAEGHYQDTLTAYLDFIQDRRITSLVRNAQQFPPRRKTESEILASREKLLAFGKAKYEAKDEGIFGRVLFSDIVTLYVLLVENKLENEIEKRKEELIAQNIPSDSWELYVLEKIVQNNRSRNKELELEEKLTRRKPLITLGVEIEYSTDMQRLLFKHDKLLKGERKTQKRELREKVEFSRADGTRSWKEERVNEYSPVVTEIAEVEPMMLKHAMELSPSGSPYMHEMSMAPSLSYRTYLRDLLTIKKGGGLEGRWNMQETIGGIDLTPEHTEIMTLRPLQEACGLFDIRNEEVLETQGKYSKVGKSYFYFSFHKRRPPREILSYAGTTKDYGDIDCAVERRRIPKYEPGSFNKLVRNERLAFLAAYGIRACQSNEGIMDEEDRTLSQAWHQLEEGFQELVEANGIRYPTEEEKYVTISPEEAMLSDDKSLVGKTYYEEFIQLVRKKALENPDFKRKARAIVTKYNRTVSRIIDF